MTLPFGPYRFVVTLNGPSLGLDYTLNSNGTISGATFTFQQNPHAQAQTFAVTFTGNSAPYSGSASMNPPLHVAGEGSYTNATFSFSPPNSLTGSFSKTDIAGDEDNISWQADASVPLAAGESAAATQKY